MDYAESIVKKWSSASIPFITPLIPGYDAHIVFPELGVYGFNNDWLINQKKTLLKYANKGLSFDVWNGFTEGYVFAPTNEDTDKYYLWAKGIIQGLSYFPGDINKDHKVNIFDYAILIQNFGKNDDCGNIADIMGDCKVNIYDYAILIQNFDLPR